MVHCLHKCKTEKVIELTVIKLTIRSFGFYLVY